MQKIISMVDFVLEQKESRNCLINYNAFEYYRLTTKYANFLKQHLEIWQFVPCKLVDGVWVILEEPQKEKYLLPKDHQNNKGNIVDLEKFTKEFKEYQQSKERCIFEGFEIITKEFNKTAYKFIQNKDTYIYFYDENTYKWTKVNDYKTIEDLVLYRPKLTAKAKKQIGL